jgi:carbamoyltransferase
MLKVCFYNGKMLGAFEKERFSKIRHDTGYVLDLAEKTLNSFGFSFDDVNLVVTSEYNHKGTEPGLNFVSSKRYEKPNDWIENATIIKNRKIPVFSIPHHLCHAAYSYYLSGKNESAVLTLDGGGDLFTIDAYTSSSVSYWINNS